MWPVCLVCLFPLPPTPPGDAEKIKQAVEAFYSEQRTPWSEVAGPFARVEPHLLRPDVGSADVTLTWISEFGTRSESHRVLIVKGAGEWRVTRSEWR